MTSNENQGDTRRQVWFAPARITAAALLLLAAACAKDPPPPPPPTIVNVKVSGTAAVNATPNGVGAPVAIRVYQLGSSIAFDREEFFRIYKEDAATMGPDLLKKDEFLLIPGATKTLTLKPMDPVHNIGVFAAYGDFQHVIWRASTEIPAHKTTDITVTADKPGIKLEAAPGKTAGP